MAKRRKFHPLATAVTRGEPRNMKNRKPYRTAAQKRSARLEATIGRNGAWDASGIKVSYHA